MLIRGGTFGEFHPPIKEKEIKEKKDMIDDSAFSGTERKFLVEITSPGFDMDRDEFEVALTKGAVQRVFHKSDMIRETYTVVEDGVEVEKTNFYLCFDTQDFGYGIIVATVVAHVPDADFADGIRDEVEEFSLMNVKNVKYKKQIWGV